MAHPRTLDAQGVSLLELLISIAIGVSAVVTLGLVFPNVGKGIVNNRSRSFAANLASGRLDTLSRKPYNLLVVTPVTQFSIITCDCLTDDFALMPSTRTLESGVAYDVWSCVNYVARDGDNVWEAQCPEAGDTGYKSLQVRVGWSRGSETYTLTQNSVKTPY